jgi:hypothetical protein
MHLLIIFVCGLFGALKGAIKGRPAQRANVVELEYWTTRMEQGAVIEALIQEAINDLGVDLMDTDVNYLSARDKARTRNWLVRIDEQVSEGERMFSILQDLFGKTDLTGFSPSMVNDRRRQLTLAQDDIIGVRSNIDDTRAKLATLATQGA